MAIVGEVRGKGSSGGATVSGRKPSCSACRTILAWLAGVLECIVLCTRPRTRYVKERTSPFGRASALSRLYFAWASPFVAHAAYQKGAPLELDDLFELRKAETANDAAAELSREWQAELDSAAAGGRTASFGRAAWRTVRWPLCRVFVFKMGWLGFSLTSNAVLLREVIVFFTSDKPIWYGILLIFLFVISELLRSACVNQHWLIASLTGIRLRAAARQLMYEKSLVLRQTRTTVGATVNMLVSDTQRLLEACQYGEFLVSTPITVAVTLAILWVQLGPSALAGFGVLLFFTPIQARVGQQVGAIRRRAAKITDERAKVMSEVLTGIKLLKLYAWEAAFADKVSHIRAREIAALRTSALVRAANNVIASSVPVLVTLAAFTAYTFWNGDMLQPSAAFVAIALFNVARFPLSIIPQATKNLSEAVVAASRLQALLTETALQAADQPIQLDSPSVAAFGYDQGVVGIESGGLGAGEVAVAVTPLPAPAQPRVALKSDGEGGDSDAGDSATALAGHNVTFEWPTHNSTGASTKRPVPVSAKAATAASDTPHGGQDGATARISDLTFTIHKGECVGVVGPVGSGKSSLLAALLGNMVRTGGSAYVRGTIAYAAQSPWVFAATVRENILFGLPFVEARYLEAVSVCALSRDFEQFPAGDASEIGERGINLSGGQRSRIGLARAVYSNRDVLLLDDPLSAVDVHVGRHIWTECIMGHLVARGKTVVIVTHQVQYLSDCSNIMSMERGRIVHFGPPAVVLPTAHLTTDGVDEVADAAPVAEVDALEGQLTSPSSHSPSGSSTGVTPLVPTSASQEIEGTPIPALPPAEACVSPSALAAATLKASDVATPATNTTTGAANTLGQLTAAEDRKMGTVSFSTLMAYFTAAGGKWLLLLLLVILLLSKGARQVSDYWLAYWTSHVDALTPVETARFYLAMYAVTAAGVLLFSAIQAFTFTVVTLRASRIFHDRVFASVMRAQSSWLDSQPTGRILSRFTGDMDLIDNALPANIEMASEYQIQVLLCIILIIAVFPWFLLPLVPIGATFVFIAQYFRRAARSLKRLDNVARSPLVSHIQATIQGLPTIRAYGRSEAFKAVNEARVDDATKAYWAFYAANRWVAIRLDTQTTLIAGVTVALCIAGHAAGSLSPAIAALAIVQALQTTGIFQFSVRLLTETEAQFTSVERLEYYSSSIPHEAVTVGTPMSESDAVALVGPPLGNTTSAQLRGAVTACGYPAWYPAAWSQALRSAQWPLRGEIVFENVCARYREDLPLVLNNVSFRIPPGSKVGCVGRTGSGKTTTTLALFRMMELAGGRIVIDGVDISKVNVYQLRSRLACIPQDPTLYSGSLRANLDVFNEFSDADILSAASKAGLSHFISSHPKGILREVAEGGTNVSLGERQLIALARALLRHARVIVMDEATASVDTATDAAIQKTIRANMADRTLFIIAHRLQTVMDCDRVLVLDGGRVVEYDAPAALLGLASRRESPVGGEAGTGLFQRMVENTGSETCAQLNRMALEAYGNAVPAGTDNLHSPAPAVVNPVSV